MDYAHVIEALRRKANDKAVPGPERELLNAKADELEAKYAKKPVKDKVVLAQFMDELMATFPGINDFPEEWYTLMDEWDDTSDWYSGAELWQRNWILSHGSY